VSRPAKAKAGISGVRVERRVGLLARAEGANASTRDGAGFLIAQSKKALGSSLCFCEALRSHE
jgi:hypothetical protein